MQLIDPKEKTLGVIVMILSTLVWAPLAYFALIPSLIALPVAYILILIGHSAFIAHLKGDSVHVSPDQLPNIHAILVECCNKLEIKTIPECYITNSHGVMNAMATNFLRKRFIILNSALISALNGNDDALAFYIGHELGHIKRRHVLKDFYCGPISILPLLGPAFSRACEYTADRHGLACSKNKESAKFALTVLAWGNPQGHTIDTAAFAKQVEQARGFWVTLNEILQTHPALCKRVAALDFANDGKRVKFPRYNPFAYGISMFIPSLTNSILVNVFATVYFVVILFTLIIAPKLANEISLADARHAQYTQAEQYGNAEIGR